MQVAVRDGRTSSRSSVTPVKQDFGLVDVEDELQNPLIEDWVVLAVIPGSGRPYFRRKALNDTNHLNRLSYIIHICSSPSGQPQGVKRE
jgi:hypothetical protein